MIRIFRHRAFALSENAGGHCCLGGRKTEQSDKILGLL